MEETLKTARLLYHTVMLICVAVLVFVVSARSVGRYEQATTALSQVASTDFQDFPRFQLHALEASSAFKEVHDVFADEFKKYGLQYSDRKVVDTLRTLPTWLAKAPKNTASLNDLDGFLRDNYSRGASVLVPSTKSLMAELPKILASGDFKCYVDLSFDPVRTDQANDEVIEFVGYLQLSHSKSCGVPIAYEQISASGVVQQIPNSSLQDWLQSLPTEQRQAIFDEQDGGSATPLPYLKAVWSEIRGKSVPDAIVLLEQKRAESAGSVSAAGISIPERLVYWAAPLIVSALLVYLQFHLAHMIRLAEAERQPLLAEFPWAPLFPGAAGNLVAGTILGVPCLAVMPLVVLRPDYHSTVWYLVPVFVLVTVFSAAWCFRYILILRACMAKSRAIEQESAERAHESLPHNG